MYGVVYFMHEGGILIAMRMQFDRAKTRGFKELVQCIVELWESGDGAAGNIHGMEYRGDIMFMCSGKVFLEDVFFVCDGKEGEDTSSAVVDYANEEWKSFLLKR